MTKRIISILLLCCACIAPIQAQLRYGIKLGAEFSHPSAKNSFDATIDGGSGFTGGLQLEYQVPICGLAFGVSALYEHRVMNVETKQFIDGILYTSSHNDLITVVDKCGGSFLVIPVDIKYKMNVGILHNLVTPYVLTGPDFAFRLNKAVGSSTHLGWNVGGGIDIVNFIQISGGYRFGMNKIYGMRDNGAFVNIGILFDF